ncbi:MAG: NUDIX hydrolase [Planctomycetota bacterium]
MKIQKLRVLERRRLHAGHAYWFEELAIQHPDGIVRPKPMVRHPGAACVIPVIDTDSGPEIVMVRNERVTIESMLLEVPAGGIDPDESPADAAARELEEESGYRAATIDPLCRFYTTPGLTDELMHVFVARELTHVGQRLEVYESLTVHRFSAAELLDMVERGDLIDGKTVLALLMAERRGVFGE